MITDNALAWGGSGACGEAGTASGSRGAGFACSASLPRRWAMTPSQTLTLSCTPCDCCERQSRLSCSCKCGTDAWRRERAGTALSSLATCTRSGSGSRIVSTLNTAAPALPSRRTSKQGIHDMKFVNVARKELVSVGTAVGACSGTLHPPSFTTCRRCLHCMQAPMSPVPRFTCTSANASTYTRHKYCFQVSTTAGGTCASCALASARVMAGCASRTGGAGASANTFSAYS